VVTLENFRPYLLQFTRDAGETWMLIGGLAVSLWREHYFPGTQPIQSKDLDLAGTRPAAYAFGRLLRKAGHKIPVITTITRREPVGLGKNYVFTLDLPGAGTTTVEVLEKLPLLDSPDEPPRGLAIEIEGIRVLDPLSLAIGKIHAFNHRKDPDGTSNDRIHLEYLEEIIPLFMEEAADRDVDLSDRVKHLSEVMDSWRHPMSGLRLS